MAENACLTNRRTDPNFGAERTCWGIEQLRWMQGTIFYHLCSLDLIPWFLLLFLLHDCSVPFLFFLLLPLPFSALPLIQIWGHWANECDQRAQISTPTPQFSSVQSLSCVRLFETPWIAARQASLSITNSWSSLRLTSIESVMPFSHLSSVIPFSSCPNPSQHQSLFQWVNSSHEVAKVLEFQL